MWETPRSPGRKFGLCRDETKVFVDQTTWCLEAATAAHHPQTHHLQVKHTEAASGTGEENITKSWRIIRHSQQEDYHLRRRLIFQLENHHMHPPEAPQKCLAATTQRFWRGPESKARSQLNPECVSGFKEVVTADPRAAWQSFSGFAKRMEIFF